jgi:hypothetical protein
MYKIYNNEIKITQNLKGGSTLTGLEDDYKKLYNKYPDSTIHESVRGFRKNSDKLKYISLKHLIPLQGYAVDFNNLEDKAVVAISNDIEKLNNVFYEGGNATLGTGYQIIDNSDPADLKVRRGVENVNDIFNKNILRYAMSWAKEIELYDVKNKKLLSYEEYEKLFANSSNSSLPKATENNKFLKVVFDKGTGSGSVKIKFQNVIKGIKKLLEVYPAVGEECAKMYPKIVKQHSLSHWQGFGGAYDNLKYSLEGGVLSTLIRVPNLSAHFKGQLNVIEARLKNSNKTLSVISKTKIQNVIDQLKKHEDYLKDTFNLLRNSHLIDENKIDVVKHKSQLEKAKMSLRKHDRYRSFLTDIIKTIRDAENSMTNKPYFS